MDSVEEEVEVVNDDDGPNNSEFSVSMRSTITITITMFLMIKFTIFFVFARSETPWEVTQQQRVVCTYIKIAAHGR